MKAIPTEFVALCNLIGKRIPVWNQGAGGNISLKENGELWIKASGSRLHEVTTSSGVARVDLTHFARLRQPSSGDDGLDEAPLA